jgi:uncharacterized protein (DUF983 family)
MGPRRRTPSTWRVLGRGMARRCPRCGAGELFRRWFTMLERCPRCGLRFERIEGHWLGAIALNLIVTELVFGVILVGGAVATWPDPPWVAIAAAGISANIAVPLAYYPFSKTTWTAVDLLMRPMELREIADAAESSEDVPWPPPD